MKLPAGVTSYPKQLKLASLEYHLQSASSCHIHYHTSLKALFPNDDSHRSAGSTGEEGKIHVYSLFSLNST